MQRESQCLSRLDKFCTQDKAGSARAVRGQERLFRRQEGLIKVQREPKGLGDRRRLPLYFLVACSISLLTPRSAASAPIVIDPCRSAAAPLGQGGPGSGFCATAVH